MADLPQIKQQKQQNRKNGPRERPSAKGRSSNPAGRPLGGDSMLADARRPYNVCGKLS
jgi:hypothetical protein